MTAVVHIGANNPQWSPASVAGFWLSNVAVLYGVAPGFGLPVPALLIAAAILCLLLPVMLLWEKLTPAHWVSWFFATSCTVISTAVYRRVQLVLDLTVPYSVSRDFTEVLWPYVILSIALAATILAMLWTYRFPIWAYFFLPLLAGLEAYHVSNTAWVGIVCALLVSLALLLANYFVLLVRDHRRDIQVVLRTLPKGQLRKLTWTTAKQCGGPILVVLTLVTIGWHTHEWLEDSVKVAFYKEGVITPSSLQGNTKIEDRDVHKDLRAMINLEEFAARLQYESHVKQAEAEGISRLDAAPRTVKGALESSTPRAISDSPCESFHVRVPLTGGIGFINQCKGLIAALNGYIAETYARTSDRVLKTVKERAAVGTETILESSDGAQDAGLEAIAAVYDELRLAVDRIFMTINAIYLVGWIVLTGSLIGSVLLVLARTLFDEERGNRFSLAPEGSSKALTFFRHTLAGGEDAKRSPVYFMDYLPAGVTTGHWHVCAVGKTLGIKGVGWSGSAIPQPLACALSRLIRSRYSMARVEIADALEAKRTGKDPAHVILPHTEEAVLVQLQPGQQVVFRMDRLLGFSPGVRLRSTYSTHVGLFFLGLGSFYCYAEGDGYLALISLKGGIEPNSQRNRVVFGDSLLAWDRRAKFGIRHPQGSKRHWMSQSQVVLHSKPSTTLTDASQVMYLGFTQHIGRLLRFLLLPF